MKPNVEFQKILEETERHLEREYGLVVRTSTQLDGVGGDLNGTEIVLDASHEPEMALYTLLHLFGHTVQWNVDSEANELGHAKPGILTEEQLAKVHEYEKNASRIGVEILRRIGHPELQEWISRWFWSDWRFLGHFYRTGERIPLVVDWENQIEILEPMDVPEFSPKVFENRQAFD